MDTLHSPSRIRRSSGGTETGPGEEDPFAFVANVEQGRAAWRYIHTSDDDPATTLQRFESMIPSLGCDCMRHYRRYKADHPPDMSSRDGLFVWGVDLHNWVNCKLHREGDTTKRMVPIDEARAIWNRPEPTTANEP